MSWNEQVERFTETAHAVGLIAATVDDPTKPGLGEWDVHALAAHTLRALVTLETYLVEPAPADEPALADASAYFTSYLAVRSVDPQRVDAAVAERGRTTAAATPMSDLASHFDVLAATVEPLLIDAGPDRHVATPWGPMRLGDYLRTRSFELVVHGLDLAAATSAPAAIPEAALADTLQLLCEVSQRQGIAADLIRVLTGRSGPNVLPILQ
jgi:hypothetical protein